MTEVILGPCLCGAPEKLEQDDKGNPIITRCPLYQCFPITDKDGKVKDEWKCAIAWMTILQIENRTATDAVAAYVESLRNEMLVRIDRVAQLRNARPIMQVLEVEEQPSGEA